MLFRIPKRFHRARLARGRLAQSESANDPSQLGAPRFLFVRGHPRSGTNWVSNLLELHPDVACAGEFHFETIYNAVIRTSSIPWQLTGREPIRSELLAGYQELMLRCISRACRDRKPTATWYCDRTPSDLLYWMSNAKYIWVLRDGRDVAVSWTFHQLRKGPDVISKSVPAHASSFLLKLSHEFKTNPTMFDSQPNLLLGDEDWVRHVGTTWDRRYRSDIGAYRHISKSQVPGGALLVKYEDLHADTHYQQQRMYEFLGVVISGAQPPTESTFTTAGYKDTSPDRYRRKGKVGDWQSYFTQESARWFNDVAGESLYDAGYSDAPDQAWAVRA